MQVASAFSRKLPSRQKLYCRSTPIGSVRPARRAGSQLASSAAPARTAAVTVNVAGSRGVHLEEELLRQPGQHPGAEQAEHHTGGGQQAGIFHDKARPGPSAGRPRAARTPSSRARCATA